MNNHNKNNKNKLNLVIMKKVIITCQQNTIINPIKHKHQVP